MKHHTRLLALAATAALLAACGKTDDSMTVGQKVDSAIASTEAKAEEAKVAAQQQLAEVKQDTAAATAKLAEKVEDAAITASVNAELAKDAQLSALKIDVDTQDGAVLLKGSAPDTASRERASTLAAGVKGVLRVDNQLAVGG